MSGADYIVFQDFSGGMNTQVARQGLPENFAAVMENLQPVAGNFLLSVPAPAPALATLAGETIVRQRAVIIGAVDYLISFCASGAAYATTIVGNGNVAAATGGVSTKFAPAGTFSASGGDVTSLNASRILIADAQSGYCTWDAVAFVQQGGVSPNFAVTAGGTGYVAPTASITGGSGSGATATVQQVAGVVTGLTLTNPGTGYLAGDTLTVTISDPAGTNATAKAHVWPFLSPKPTTLAVAFGRVWLASGRTLTTSGTGSTTFGAGYDDFATADAALTTTISDIDLIHQITALRFLNNYLYIIGDNSVKSIGSISVAGSVTSFTVTTLSSDQGTIYQDTCLSYNRLILFANTVAVYAVFGASVEKISDHMDGIFRAIDFSQPLQAAVNDINNIHTFLLLVRFIDPATATRSLILSFANRRWYTIAQGASVKTIATAVLGGITETFGSSGNDITQLIQSTSTGVNYKLSTSLTAHGNPIVEKRVVRAGIAVTTDTTETIDMTVDSESGAVDANLSVTPLLLTVTNAQGQIMTFNNASGNALQIALRGFALARSGTTSQTGRYIGATLTGNSNDIVIQSVFLETKPGAPWGKG